MPPRKLTDKQREKIAALREAGVPTHAIASRLGCSEGAVTWYCLVNGIEPPPGRRRRLQPVPKKPKYYKRADGRKARFFTADEDARLLEMERMGLNYTEIGRELDRKHNVIHGRLARLARRGTRTENPRD